MTVMEDYDYTLPDLEEVDMVPENVSHYTYSMGWMCQDPLFDTRHWYTDIPDFSVCLQKTILIWLPCGFLWAAAPFLIYRRLKQTKQIQIPHTLLNIVATILAVGLVVLALADLIYFANDAAASLVDILDPTLRGLTYVMVTILIQLNRIRGCRNSAVLWIFWTMSLILGVPRLYSQLRREVDSSIDGDLTETISYIVTFVSIFAQWILAFFMDARPTYAIGEGETFLSFIYMN